MVSETIQSIKTTELQASDIISQAEKQCIEILNEAAARAGQISETRKTETKSQSERDMEAAREKGRQILEDAGKAIAEEVKSLKAEVSGKKEAAIDFVNTKLV